MKTWQPTNYKGSIYYDPRDELRARAQNADINYERYFIISYELAMACADLHECGATTIMTSDEDGILRHPLEIRCTKPRDHLHIHGNGYTNWVK